VRWWLGASRDELNEEALGALGFAPAEPQAPQVFEVWPDVWPLIDLFAALGTQWDYGPGGRAIGLKYAGVESVLRLRRVPRAEWAELFDDIRTFERTALDVWRESK
jgi:hypothetical protein